MFLSKNNFNKLNKTSDNIIFKVFIIANRNNGIFIGWKMLYFEASHIPLQHS